MGQKEYYDGGSVVKSLVKLFDPDIHPIPRLPEHASPAHGKVDTGDWRDGGDVRWGDGGDAESPLCLPEQVTCLSRLVSLSSRISLVPPTSRAVDLSLVTRSLSSLHLSRHSISFFTRSLSSLDVYELR